MQLVGVLNYRRCQGFAKNHIKSSSKSTTVCESAYNLLVIITCGALCIEAELSE